MSHHPGKCHQFVCVKWWKTEEVTVVDRKWIPETLGCLPDTSCYLFELIDHVTDPRPAVFPSDVKVTGRVRLVMDPH